MKSVTTFHTKAEADEIVCLSASEKMPGRSWGISPTCCKRGSILHQQAGTICSTCYARGGRFVFDNVNSKMARRLKGFRNPRWVEAAAYLLADEQLFRWFDTGDIQDAEMLGKIVEVVERTPRCRHWLATREIDIVRGYLQDHAIPDNLNIRLSADYIDQAADLPSVAGCTVSTVTRDGQAAGAHNCPVTFSDDKRGCVEANCFACWERSVGHVNYGLHTMNSDAAYVVVGADDLAEFGQHNAEPIEMVVSVADIAPLELTPEMARMRVDDVVTNFRSRVREIFSRGGFQVNYQFGREVVFHTNWVMRVESNQDRQDKALLRLQDVYAEFKIPATTAQLWKRVVECVDPDLLAGRTTMAMLAEIGISKLDVLVGLAGLDETYWRFDEYGAILLSEALTEGPFDVRQLTVDDLKDIYRRWLEEKRRRETPVPVAASDTTGSLPPPVLSPVADGSVTETVQATPALNFDVLHAHDVDEVVAGNVDALESDMASDTATETATVVLRDERAVINVSLAKGSITDPDGNQWAVRVCNGALSGGWDSTASSLEIVPESSDQDAYAVLQAPSMGDGMPPTRQLLWYDNLFGMTRNFPLT